MASALHVAVLAAIHAEAFPPEARWNVDAMAQQISLPGSFGIFARPDPDAPPGGCLLARVAADEAEILTLAVLPALRRQGLASVLLHAAENRAEIAGARSMFLEVAADNAAARALYGGRDYRPVGLRRGYYGPGKDALVLRRQLGPPRSGVGIM